MIIVFINAALSLDQDSSAMGYAHAYDQNDQENAKSTHRKTSKLHAEVYRCENIAKKLRQVGRFLSQTLKEAQKKAHRVRLDKCLH
ncbi:MAG: hypothetical protein AAF788_00065 [Pseudomonadota bacterium]